MAWADLTSSVSVRSARKPSSAGTNVAAVWDGILCQFFGFLIVGIILVINGRAGAVYHVSRPLPRLSRLSC
jgi:cytosine/uracil/thiamine/allantoin permease